MTIPNISDESVARLCSVFGREVWYHSLEECRGRWIRHVRRLPVLGGAAYCSQQSEHRWNTSEGGVV